MFNYKKITINIIIGYIISWLYFLVTTSFIQRLIGKSEGILINYGLSCIIWVVIFHSLHTLNPNGDR